LQTKNLAPDVDCQIPLVGDCCKKPGWQQADPDATDTA